MIVKTDLLFEALVNCCMSGPDGGVLPQHVRLLRAGQGQGPRRVRVPPPRRKQAREAQGHALRQRHPRRGPRRQGQGRDLRRGRERRDVPVLRRVRVRLHGRHLGHRGGRRQQRLRASAVRDPGLAGRAVSTTSRKFVDTFIVRIS